MVSKKLLLVEERGEGKHGLCRGLLHLLVNFASSGHVLVKHSLLVTLLDAQDRLEEMFHDPGLPRHLHRHVSMGSNGLELAAVNKKQKTTSFPPFHFLPSLFAENAAQLYQEVQDDRSALD